jgi:hypothetical protein
MRLWEAEASLHLKMTLDEWYTLPLIEREQIIATRIAEKIVDGLVQKDAYDSARKK